MGNFEKLMAETKGLLKDLLKSDSSKEDIEKVTAIDKSLDSLTEENNKQETELKDYKEMLLNQVKNTGFSVNGKQPDDSGVSETKDLDSVINESLNKVIQARKN